MNCIVTTHPEFKALAEETKLPLYELDYKVALWQEKHNEFDRFPSKEELTKDVTYSLKATKTIVDNLDRIKSLWRQIPDKDVFWNKIQKDFAIPKEQVELFKNSEGNTIEEKLTNFLANYSYTIEINTAKDKIGSDYYGKASVPKQIIDRDGESVTGGKIGQYWVEFINNDGDPDIRVFDTFEEANKAVETQQGINNSTVYSNLTVPGGTNYTENEISTPLITPSIKGHAQFATDNGIGWFRSDDRKYTEEIETEELENDEDKTSVALVKSYPEIGGPKTRRILEVQSDLYQKGRNLGDIEQIIKDLQKSGDLKIDCN